MVSALPGLERLGCAWGQPASPRDCTWQLPLQPSRPVRPSANTELEKEGSEISTGPAHALGPCPVHPAVWTSCQVGSAMMLASSGTALREQQLPRHRVLMAGRPAHVLWYQPAHSRPHFFGQPQKQPCGPPPGYQPRGQGPHSLAVPSGVGVPSLRAPPLSSQVLVTLRPLPQPQESAPAHSASLAYSLVLPFLLFWFSSTCSPNFLY